MKTLREIKEMDFWRSEEGRKRGSIGVKGRKAAEMIYKATYQEPHCWSMWLCWEVSHSSAGRPPCCTSDKKPNICFLSELHSLWDPARALPLSVCVFFQCGSWFCFMRLQWQVVNQHHGMMQYHSTGHRPWDVTHGKFLGLGPCI